MLRAVVKTCGTRLNMLAAMKQEEYAPKPPAQAHTTGLAAQASGIGAGQMEAVL
jgi:hypothetical protein